MSPLRQGRFPLKTFYTISVHGLPGAAVPQKRKEVLIMKQFTHTISDPVGIHARPAGLLAKAAKGLDSTITITKADGSKSAAATKLMALMGMGIKTGETVTITVEGGNEEANAATMEQFFKENL